MQSKGHVVWYKFAFNLQTAEKMHNEYGNEEDFSMQLFLKFNGHQTILLLTSEFSEIGCNLGGMYKANLNNSNLEINFPDEFETANNLSDVMNNNFLKG